MKNVMLCASLVIAIGTSCQHSADIEPAQSIDGTYQAQDYNHFTSSGDAIAYPINGQTLSLTIRSVSADTVSVVITPSASTSPLPDGVYSPTQTLSYPKAYVGRTATASYIYLTGKSATSASANNQIWLYKDSPNADYIFIPTQTPSITKAIRFVKQ